MNFSRGLFSVSLAASIATVVLASTKDAASGFSFDYTGYSTGTSTQNFAVTGQPDIQISYGNLTGAGGTNGSGAVAGFAGFVNAQAGGAPNTTTPLVTTNIIGNNTGQKLWLGQNLPDTAATTDVFTQADANKNIINFIFNVEGASAALTTVSKFGFTIFDIDSNDSNGNSYRDFVGIQGCTGATALTSCTVLPTLTATDPTAVTINNAVGTIQATSTNASVANTANNGNVFVNFSGTAVNSIRIFYGSGTGLTNTGPTLQQIGISPFQPVPFEFETGLGLSLLGGFWGIQKLKNRKLKAKTIN